MDIGNKIRFLREQKGLTLEQLGNMVGVGKSTVRKWETGQIANMRRDKIQKLANALGVSPLDIISSDSHEFSDYDLSHDELHLISLYRRADEIDRQTIKNILSRYDDASVVLSMAARGGKTAPLDGRPDADEIEAAIKATPSESE